MAYGRTLTTATIATLLAAMPARAHCPLCTTAVGGAVIGAAALGMPVGVVALFGGALIASSGLWTARILKKRVRSPWARSRWIGPAIVLATLASLLIPLRFVPAVVTASTSAELLILGSWQWMVYIDWLLVGALLGAGTLWLGGHLSERIRAWKGRSLVPFQMILVTFALLVAESGVLAVLR